MAEKGVNLHMSKKHRAYHISSAEIRALQPDVINYIANSGKHSTMKNCLYFLHEVDNAPSGGEHVQWWPVMCILVHDSLLITQEVVPLTEPDDKDEDPCCSTTSWR